MVRALVLVLLLLGSSTPPAPAQNAPDSVTLMAVHHGGPRVLAVAQLRNSAPLFPPSVVVDPDSPRIELGDRFESVIAGAGYGALVGGATDGLADYLLGPFWNTPVHGFSVALTSLFGAVFVGMPVGAVIGALRGG